MVAEVCSVYVHARRRGAGAVRHRGPASTRRCTRPACGSARAWSATSPPRAAARRWPTPSTIRNFAYRPETGEEIYHSLMGVPILRAGRVLGVLVVQNRTRRALHRGRDRGAADHRHGAGRAGRRRRAGQPGRAAPRRRHRAAAAAARRRHAEPGPGASASPVLHEPGVAAARSWSPRTPRPSSSACAAALMEMQSCARRPC